MSETTLVWLITAAIIAVMFAWVPLMHLVCPPCSRYLVGLRRRQPGSSTPTADRGLEPEAPLASRKSDRRHLADLLPH